MLIINHIICISVISVIVTIVWKMIYQPTLIENRNIFNISNILVNIKITDFYLQFQKTVYLGTGTPVIVVFLSGNVHLYCASEYQSYQPVSLF